MTDPQMSAVQRRIADYSRVLAQLESLCKSLPTGARVPTHTVLMRQLNASERTVLRALDELKRAGRVVRRNGAGTFIAGNPPPSIQITSQEEARCIVALAEPDGPFFDHYVPELFRCTDAVGFSLICRPVRSDAQLPLPGVLPARGYVLFGPSLVPLGQQLQQAGCRVVVVGAPPEEGVPELSCVFADPEHGGYLAVHHLLQQGHRRLAFCGGPHREHTARWRGYQRALHEAQGAEVCVLPPDLEADWSADPAGAAAFFRRAHAPTALVAESDRQALALLSALTRAGVQVPRELSVVGYGALPEAERLYPALTTVDEAWCQQLQAALRLLTGPVVAPRSPAATIVVPSLVIRESTQPPCGS